MNHDPMNHDRPARGNIDAELLALPRNRWMLLSKRHAFSLASRLKATQSGRASIGDGVHIFRMSPVRAVNGSRYTSGHRTAWALCDGSRLPPNVLLADGRVVPDEDGLLKLDIASRPSQWRKPDLAPLNTTTIPASMSEALNVIRTLAPLASTRPDIAAIRRAEVDKLVTWLCDEVGPE